MRSVTRKNDVIMQNHSVEKGKSLLYNTNENDKKEKLRVTFCLNIFKPYVTICHMVLVADKNKLIPFLYLRNSLDTEFLIRCLKLFKTLRAKYI
jgi:hypothetical protein